MSFKKGNNFQQVCCFSCISASLLLLSILVRELLVKEQRYLYSFTDSFKMVTTFVDTIRYV